MTEPAVSPADITHAPRTVIEVCSVTRRFGPVLALDSVSLSIGAGELVGVLGPNGAGKSTLLSLLSGQRLPDSGTVRLLGGDPRAAASRIGLGITPQETGLPATLRVGEVVDFVARHYPDPESTGVILDRFGLGDLAGRQTGALSGGQRRRLAIALALVGRPQVILLDEPTTGLDVDARATLWQVIRDYHADGGTVLLTSHYLEEVQALAQRVVVVDRGVIRADDTLDAILATVVLHRVTVRSSADLSTMPGAARYSRQDEYHEIYTSDADEFVRELVRSGVDFHGLRVQGATLEEALSDITSQSIERTAS